MIAEGLNAADQLVIDHARIAVFQLAHLLVEQRDQILDAVRHRRIGGEAGVARIAPFAEHAIGAGAVLQIDRLGQRDKVGKDFNFFLDAGTAAEESVHRLFEIEQPERQAQIARRKHLRLVAEAAGIFVVRIDQEDAQIRPRGENGVQNDGDAARFADAGGAEDGEVAADQMIDVDVHADIGVLLQVTDKGVIGVGLAVDEAQFALGQQHGGIADARVIGDAALEARRAVFAGLNFADQIEARDFAEILPAIRRRQCLLAHFGDQADDQGFAADQAHEIADGGTFAGHARALSSMLACEPETAETRPSNSGAGR